MLKRIVMQLSGLLMAQFTQVLALLTALLWKAASSLRASFTRLYLNVVSQLALIGQKLKLYLAGKTKSDTLPKPEPTFAPAELIHHGSQHLKVAAQLQQPATTLSLPKKDPAEKTKSEASLTSANKTAKRHTRKQSTAGGLKSKGHASQRQQRAKSQRKKGR